MLESELHKYLVEL